MKNLARVILLLFFMTCTVVPNFVFGESCPTVDHQFLIGKSLTSIPTSGGFKVANPSDFNQMHLHFDAKYLHAYVVDFNHAGNIKDILVKFQVPYSVNQGRVTFGSNSMAICGLIYGEFTPKNQQIAFSACVKWDKYFRSYGNDNVFQTQFTNNCSRINFESSSLSLIMEESERYPNEFCNDFVERSDWYVSQFNQNQIFVQFSNIKTVAGYKLGSYQMAVKNQVGECAGSQALFNGEFEIFSNFSLINSNVTSCQYSNANCNMCTDDKLKTLLFGLISRNSECTEFSLSEAQNFKVSGQPGKPFNLFIPYNPETEDPYVMIGIGASLGSALVLVCISILVVGLVYFVRRKNQKSYENLI